MEAIQVDFEVWKTLTNRRSSELVTYNDVLRKLLGLKPASHPSMVPSPVTSGVGDWISKGVHFPVGTEFRATYKGEPYSGKVEGGALVIRGDKFYSPSSAAMSITKGSVNGWTFWEAKRPGENWRMLKTLRNGR